MVSRAGNEAGVKARNVRTGNEAGIKAWNEACSGLGMKLGSRVGMTLGLRVGMRLGQDWE